MRFIRIYLIKRWPWRRTKWANDQYFLHVDTSQKYIYESLLPHTIIIVIVIFIVVPAKNWNKWMKLRTWRNSWILYIFCFAHKKTWNFRKVMLTYVHHTTSYVIMSQNLFFFCFALRGSRNLKKKLYSLILLTFSFALTVIEL